MDQAKDKIQIVYNDVEDRLLMIDEINNFTTIACCRFFLHPQLHYAPRFTIDLEVRNGLFNVIIEAITINYVVFVMTNSKLAKKKQTRKDMELNIIDISSDDEWIMKYI
ncbi:hypothetical protein Lal_00018393 [Lupinus albus]|nr:hypothetical protein Lal_00018393 [Lupinus albus]